MMILLIAGLLLFCAAILEAVERMMLAPVQLVQTIVRTVCRTIQTVEWVFRQVCTWLPWPLDQLCNWVRQAVTVVRWVCENVVETVVTTVEVLVRYIAYILRWVCWVIEWPKRFLLDYLPCVLGLDIQKKIRVCVKILDCPDCPPLMTPDQARQLVQNASTLLQRECNVVLELVEISILPAPIEHCTTECSFVGALLSADHVFFERHRCLDALTAPLTIYVVKEIEGSTVGCSVPRNSYLVIEPGVSPDTVLHEMGHLSDLTHRDDTGNIMHGHAGGTSFTRHQCCMVRSARFTGVV